MTMMLSGRIAIVTGGLSGIGAATVARFADEGATVIAADLAAAQDGLQAAGAAFHYKTDVADAASVARLVDAVVARFGRIDILVNAAGIGRDVPFLETSEELFDRMLAVNLRGTFLIGQAVARQMVAAGGGRIINIASISGRRGNAGRTAYGASKGGVVTLSEVMAIELAAHNILVNVIAPGPIDTSLAQQMHTPAARQRWIALTPLGRYGSPEEVAGAAAFLAGPDASYMTGHVLHVDGGLLAGGMLPERAAIP